MQLSRNAHDTLIEGIEELVYEICSQELVSGEALYTVINCFSEAKLAEYAGELSPKCDT